MLRGAAKTMLSRHLDFLPRTLFLRTLCSGRSSKVGTKSFEDIRKDKSLYVDKTEFAEKLLHNQRAVLMRPPRTGKTLFLDMLDYLFDKSNKAKFDDLFGDLYFAKCEARDQANTYYVLPITLPAGPLPDDLAACKKEYHQRAMIGVNTLLGRHPDVEEKLKIPQQTYYEQIDYAGCITAIRDIVGRENLMVLVDEYDRAPMEEYISQVNKYGLENYDSTAPSNVKGALQQFLFTVKDLGCRYLVTGINTVPGADTCSFIHRASIYSNVHTHTHKLRST